MIIVPNSPTFIVSSVFLELVLSTAWVVVSRSITETLLFALFLMLQSLLVKVETLTVNPNLGVTSFSIKDSTDKVRSLCNHPITPHDPQIVIF